MQQNNDEDPAWLTNHEEEFLQNIDDDYEITRSRLEKEKEQSIKNIWTYFQDSAQYITQLYKDRQISNEPTASCWLPFQTAAGTVTKLYKESCDGMKRSNDLANQVGYQRRSKEIAEWARSKKRPYIRRDDLLSYLAGKPLPPVSANHHHYHHNNHHLFSSSNVNVSNNNNNNNSTQQVALMWPPLGATSPRNTSNHFNHLHHHHHHNNLSTGGINTNSTRLHQLRLSPKPESPNHNHNDDKLPFCGQQCLQSNATDNSQSGDSADLHTFREALALRSRARPELYAFVAGEIARHSKRPASPLDVNMDSPNINKRPRYTYE
uniref:CSON009416 protein n=2 Tax=Culicoides sonorensis TaxID=179676 RepID=A0A336M3Z2_CULSO